MALDFPSTSGQATDGSFKHTVGSKQWSWDGTSWNLVTNASNYAHPDHTGDVTSNADGATTIADDKVEEKHINAGGTVGPDKVLVYDSNEATNWKWGDQSSGATYTIEALLSPGIQLLDDGNAGADNRIFFESGTGVSVVRTSTAPHNIEFKSSFTTVINKTTTYNLQATDIGKTIKITSPGGGVNLQLGIPDLSSSLSFGDEVRILNGAADSIDVTTSATTLHWCQSATAGGNGGYSTGNREIHGYALITLTYKGNNEWNIHGDGVY